MGTPVWLLIALQCCVFGCLLLHWIPFYGALAFGGGSLGVAVLLGRREGAGTGLAAPQRRRPNRLEFSFVAALFLFSSGTRLYRLDRYPAGPGFVESAMSLDAQNLSQADYTPHVDDPQACFPSLVFYQGLACARWLGWKVQNFRIPAALWGALSVLAFYFFLRQIGSVFAAGLFAFLYSVNDLHLTESRLFFPGTLIEFSATATAALLWAALTSGSRLLYAAAGLACGLALHGYVPGRLLLPAYAGWLLLVLWTGPGAGRQRPRAGDVLLFLGGGLLAASPVLWWAWKHPAEYWALVQGNGGSRPGTALLSAARRLPDYLKLFYTRPDGALEPTDGLALFPLLRPDWLTQVLLPIGLAGCVLAFWRPLSALVLGGFLLGLLPAAASENFPHPCTRRALLVLPFAYAAAALAWDRMAAFLDTNRAPRWMKRALLLASLGLAGFAGWGSLHEYFIEIMSRPSVRSAYDAPAAIVENEIEGDPRAEARVSYDLVAPYTYLLVGWKDEASRTLGDFANFIVLDRPRRRGVIAVKPFEDFLVFRDRGPRLLLLAPRFAPALPLLQTLFPHGLSKVYEEKRDFRSGMPPWDPYEPYVQLARFAIPAGDVAAFTGLVDLSRPPYAPGSRLGTGSGSFADGREGRRLDLGGVLVADETAGSFRFVLPWPGWSLRVDGKSEALGRAFRLDLGAHRFELAGLVPQRAKGPLPLRVGDAGEDWGREGRVLPLDPRYGLSESLDTDGGGVHVTRYDPLPMREFAPPEGISLPCGAEFRARLRVPASGKFGLRVRPPYHGRVFVDRELVYDDTAPVPVQRFIALKAGVPETLRIECRVDREQDHQKTLVLDYLGAQSPDWAPLPFPWVLAP